MVAGLEHNIHIPEDSLLRTVKNKNILRTHIAVQPGDKLPKLRIAPCLGIPESLPEICLFCAGSISSSCSAVIDSQSD